VTGWRWLGHAMVIKHRMGLGDAEDRQRQDV
jgi:hypothetical protein